MTSSGMYTQGTQTKALVPVQALLLGRCAQPGAQQRPHQTTLTPYRQRPWLQPPWLSMRCGLYAPQHVAEPSTELTWKLKQYRTCLAPYCSLDRTSHLLSSCCTWGVKNAIFRRTISTLVIEALSPAAYQGPLSDVSALTGLSDQLYRQIAGQVTDR